jgi:hypothetical protein
MQNNSEEENNGANKTDLNVCELHSHNRGCISVCLNNRILLSTNQFQDQCEKKEEEKVKEKGEEGKQQE